MNTNVRLKLSVHRQPVLLRLYTRDPNADAAPMPEVAAKEAALHRLLAPKLPVPRVIFAAPDNPITGHAYMLRDWADGQRLEVVTHEQTRAVLVGLATRHRQRPGGRPQRDLCCGWVSRWQVNVVPLPLGIGGRLPDLLEALLGVRGKERLGPDLTQALMAFAQREPTLGATWPGPPSLTHADFGGSNILVHLDERGAPVAAVIDWEFAFSGSPMMDLGNLLRPPIGERRVSGSLGAGACRPVVRRGRRGYRRSPIP